MNAMVSQAVACAFAPSVVDEPEKVSDAKKRVRLQKILSIAMVIAVVVLMMTMPVFATGKNLQNSVQDGMESIWKLMRYISYGVAIVYVAVAAYKLVLGGQRGMETAKGDLLKMVFFLALILLAPYVISTVVDWFGGNNAFGKNPMG